MGGFRAVGGRSPSLDGRVKEVSGVGSDSGEVFCRGARDEQTLESLGLRGLGTHKRGDLGRSRSGSTQGCENL